MIKIINFFANILSYIINPIYAWVENYGIAVIIFTLIVKLIMIPLGIKQQETMVKTKKIKPELDAINRKYKNDKEKLNQETMKIYQKHDINPMGGCLPLLLQFPIILGLYRVIQFPITWILKGSPENEINRLIEAGKITLEGAVETLKGLAPEGIDISGLSGIGEIIGEFGQKVSQIDIASAFELINFDFLGINLSLTPSIYNVSWLWIIPILATGSAFFSNWVTKKINPVSEEQEQATKGMTMMMPLMTAFFTFTLPAGIGLYWFISTIFSVAQMYLLNKYFEKKYPADEKAGKGNKK